jgi:anti-sigma factor RsiW
MKDHQDYKNTIQLLVDDEITGQEREDLLSHIESCADCRQIWEEERALSRQIRDSRPQIQVPAALRERIEKEIADFSKRESNSYSIDSAKAYSKKSSTYSYWKPLAAAAVFCIVVGGMLSFSYWRRQDRAMRFVEAAIADHSKSADDALLDVSSDSPQVVSSWFSQRVSFPFRMPNAGIASDDRAKYKLVGGRLVDFGGEPAALLVFRVGNNRISLLVASDKLAKATGGKVSLSEGLTFHARDIDNLHIATWNNKGLTYALVSSLVMGNGSSCSRCHNASPSGMTPSKDMTSSLTARRAILESSWTFAQ